MKPNLFIKNLSKVILKETRERKNGKIILDGLKALSDLVMKNSQFHQLLLSKRVNFEDKKTILSNILNSYVDEYVLGIIFLLIEENQVKQLSALTRTFEDDFIKENKISKVTVYQAVSGVFPDKELKDLIQNAVGQGIDYRTVTDPKLIGGVKLRIDNKIVDGSIAHQMEVMRKLLLETSK